MKASLSPLWLLALAVVARAQPAPAASPGPAVAPDGPRRSEAVYPVPYDPMPVEGITAVLERIHAYLDATTPARLVDRETGAEITDHSAPSPNAVLARGDFRLVSYEWGVTYAGMLHAAAATGDRRYADYVATRVKFIADGTLARNRPLHNALWLDDLYMSVPALAQMGALTGDSRYFDDAVRQVLQFSARMFVPSRGLYMHGWIEGMEPHPVFHWARANGWAIVAMASSSACPLTTTPAAMPTASCG